MRSLPESERLLQAHLPETKCNKPLSFEKGESEQQSAHSNDMATTKKQAAKKSSSGSDPKSKRIVKNKMQETMHEFKHHDLQSGRSGKKVKNPKQAIAIGLSEARRSGANIPPSPNQKKASAKKTAAKKSTPNTSAKKAPAKKAAPAKKSTTTKKSTAKKSSGRK
jgi:Family of unknown function (DUF6496)